MHGVSPQPSAVALKSASTPSSFSYRAPSTRLVAPSLTRKASSRVTIGDTPCIACISALDSGISPGSAAAASATSSGVCSRIFSFFCASGSSYLMLGSTKRRLLIVRSTRLMASIITLVSRFITIRLLYMPMISQTMLSPSMSPSSLIHSKSRNSTRSQPSCRTPTSLPPPSRLRSSMQNIGGCAGFSGVLTQKLTRGELARDDSSSFLLPS